MSDEITITWAFSPEDFFEEDTTLTVDGKKLEITRGQIKVFLNNGNKYQSEEDLKKVANLIENVLLTAQVANNRPFTLNKSSYKKSDLGGKNQTIGLSSHGYAYTAGTLDIKVMDKNGNVISDTKAERIHDRDALISSCAPLMSQDDVLRRIVKSYSQSVHVSSDELVHLYAILEALEEKFGNEKKVSDELQISRKKLNKFTMLSNNRRQGRHRGIKSSDLQKATEEELQYCRGISKSLISEYARWLGMQNLSSGKTN